jgi:hypothetical protein
VVLTCRYRYAISQKIEADFLSAPYPAASALRCGMKTAIIRRILIFGMENRKFNDYLVALIARTGFPFTTRLFGVP